MIAKQKLGDKMDFTKYRNAADLLQQTGWTVETALNVVEAELKKLREE